MKCTSISTETVCFTNGAGVSRTLVAHYEYGVSTSGSAVLIATRYTEADGLTVVDTTGGTIVAGTCPVKVTEIVPVCYDSGSGLVDLNGENEYSVAVDGTRTYLGTVYRRADGLVFDVIGGGGSVTVGVCDIGAKAQFSRRVYSRGQTLASGAFVADYDPQGLGPTLALGSGTATGLTSVTVKAVKSGLPSSADSVVLVTVDDQGAPQPEYHMLEGETQTWSASTTDFENWRQFLDEPFRIECRGNAVAQIAWTEVVG